MRPIPHRLKPHKVKIHFWKDRLSFVEILCVIVTSHSGNKHHTANVPVDRLQGCIIYNDASSSILHFIQFINTKNIYRYPGQTSYFRNGLKMQ